jgi:Xaa-Pro aminopeptidase
MARMDSPAGRRKVFSDKLKKDGVRFAIVSNPKHIFYLTGVSSNLNPYYVLGKGQRSTSFLAVGDEGQSSLLLGASEFWSPWAREQVSGKAPDPSSLNGVDLSLYSDYSLDVTMVPYGAEIAPEVKRWVRKLMKVHGWRSAKRGGVEEWHLPAIHRQVVSKSFDGKLVGVSQTILDMRKTKGKDELENVRLATKALDYAYGFAKPVAKEGKSELDMHRAMNDAVLEKFGVFGFIGGDVVSGEKNLEVGGMATRRKFRRGETIIIDMQTTHNNYWSDTARTFAVGRPSKEQENALDVVLEAKELASRMLKPGTRTADIANAVNRLMKRRGYDEMPHHVGHTIGLDDQERPWLIRGSDDVVRENQAYVIEPGVYNMKTGGVRVEDCYFVTRAGVEKISSFPTGL